jgi:hypothetical protein
MICVFMSTLRIQFMSTENDLGLNVDIEHCALGQQKMNRAFMLTKLPPARPGEGDSLG